MSPLLFAALVMVLSHQPILHMETIPAPVVTVVSDTAAGKVETVLYGWSTCTTTEYQDGRRVGHVDRIVAVPASVKADTLEHEALHSADCLDDGVVNGSLLPYPPTWKDAGHEFVYWCQDNETKCIEILREATK